MGWNPWLAAAFLLFAFPVYHVVIRKEEEFLAGKFGEEFAAYARAVPRFLPRLAAPAEVPAPGPPGAPGASFDCSSSAATANGGRGSAPPR